MRHLFLLGGLLAVLLAALIWKLGAEGSRDPEGPRFRTSTNSTVMTLALPEGQGLPMAPEGADRSPGLPSPEAPATSPRPAVEEPDGVTDLAAGDAAVPPAAAQAAPASAAGEPGGRAASASVPEPAAGEAAAQAGHPESSAGKAATPAAAGGAIRYTVRKGEGLWSILRQAYGRVTPELIAAVARHNSLEDPSRLRAGQELELPRIEGWPAPRDPARKP